MHQKNGIIVDRDPFDIIDPNWKYVAPTHILNPGVVKVDGHE
jgi:hypothetical protein